MVSADAFPFRQSRAEFCGQFARLTSATAVCTFFPPSRHSVPGPVEQFAWTCGHIPISNSLCATCPAEFPPSLYSFVALAFPVAAGQHATTTFCNVTVTFSPSGVFPPIVVPGGLTCLPLGVVALGHSPKSTAFGRSCGRLWWSASVFPLTVPS
jgi:hypothetical protein